MVAGLYSRAGAGMSFLLPRSSLLDVTSFWQLLGEKAFPELKPSFPLRVGVDCLLSILC